MKELQRRQKIKQMLYSWPSIVVMAFVTFFLLKGAIGIASIERESAAKVKDLEAQAEELSKRGKELEEDINKLRTEEGIIEEIKKKFSVTREGENVAVIVEAKTKPATTSTSTVLWLKDAWTKVKNLWGNSGSGYNTSQ